MTIGTTGLCVLMATAAAVGYGACALQYGVWTDAAGAAVKAQATLETGIAAHDAIQDAEASATAAREQVRIVTRVERVYDPALCPPGSCDVSAPVADQLRAALKANDAATRRPPD